MPLPVGMLDRLRAAFSTGDATYQAALVKEIGDVYAENVELKAEVARWSKRVKLLEGRAERAMSTLVGK
jgi:hypothetical protein